MITSHPSGWILFIPPEIRFALAVSIRKNGSRRRGRHPEPMKVDVDGFAAHGYVVVENVLSGSQIAQMQLECNALLESQGDQLIDQV